MNWLIGSYPKCTHHVFLSHCAEDREQLVLPVAAALRAHGVEPWVDRHNYPHGRPSREALRSSLLKCRHAVFFITEAMLASPRGWCVLELAYAELIQANLTRGTLPLVNVVMPLFFGTMRHEALERSVWRRLLDSAVPLPIEDAASSIQSAADAVHDFLLREQEHRSDVAEKIRGEAALSDELNLIQGKRNRCFKFQPSYIGLRATP